MMENLNKFSLQRMMSLTGKIVMEQPKIFLMRVLLLFGTLIIGALFIGFENSHNYRYGLNCNDPDLAVEIEFPFFVTMMYVFAVIYTSFAFSDAKTKPGRISMLMLPARYAEKYFSRFIVYIAAFPIVFFFAAWAADVIRVITMSLFYYEGVGRIHFMTFRDIHWRDVSIVMAVLLAVQSFYWLGAILWPRNSFIKTFAAMSVLSALYSITAPLMFFLIIGKNNSICGVPGLDNVMAEYFSEIVWGISILVCIINYTITYMRLKETEVIQRLL